MLQKTYTKKICKPFKGQINLHKRPSSHCLCPHTQSLKCCRIKHKTLRGASVLHFADQKLILVNYFLIFSTTHLNCFKFWPQTGPNDMVHAPLVTVDLLAQNSQTKTNSPYTVYTICCHCFCIQIDRYNFIIPHGEIKKAFTIQYNTIQYNKIQYNTHDKYIQSKHK